MTDITSGNPATSAETANVSVRCCICSCPEENASFRTMRVIKFPAFYRLLFQLLKPTSAIFKSIMTPPMMLRYLAL